MNERFPDLARRAFSFLESEGFDITDVDAEELRYESSRTVVSVQWDARSGEQEVFVMLRSPDGAAQPAYSLTDMLAMEGVRLDAQPPQVHEENRLQPFLERSADALRTHCRDALSGQRSYFQRLEEFRRVHAEALTQQIVRQRVRSDVEQAWRAQEYETVIELYTSILGDLSDLEKSRLEYAKRHASNK
jgi:hypothetical protein